MRCSWRSWRVARRDGPRSRLLSLRELFVQKGDALQSLCVLILPRPLGEQFFQASLDVRIGCGASGGDAKALEERFVGKSALKGSASICDQSI